MPKDVCELFNEALEDKFEDIEPEPNEEIPDNEEFDLDEWDNYEIEESKYEIDLDEYMETEEKDKYSVMVVKEQIPNHSVLINALETLIEELGDLPEPQMKEISERIPDKQYKAIETYMNYEEENENDSDENESETDYYDSEEE